MSNTMKKRNQAITQNESLPYVSISNKTNHKYFLALFLSEKTLMNELIDMKFLIHLTKNKKGDTRIYINSVGEGYIWIINKNGPLQAGDYITTCDLSGY